MTISLKALNLIRSSFSSRLGAVCRVLLPGKAICRTLVTALLLGLLSLGCAAGKVKDPVSAAAPTIVWPTPPAKARIAFIRTLATPDDIKGKKGFFTKVLDLILGARLDKVVKPYGIAVDSKGRVIVVDTASRKIHLFDMDKKKYSAVSGSGSYGFISPIGVAVDVLDNIYVTDSGLGLVLVLNPDGRFLYAIEGLKRPSGIAINKVENLVYVVDTIEHKVNVYDLRGVFKRSIGTRGTEDGEFNFPVDIFIDNHGDIYVSDALNFRVQVLTSEGRFITAFGTQGDGSGAMAMPKGVAVDSDGHIYLVDALFDTVQIFDREGNFLLNFGARGSSDGDFYMPAGVFIDENSYIYVADAYNGRVQVFEYLGL